MIYEFFRRYYGSYFRKHDALESAINSVEEDSASGEAFGIGIIDTDKRKYYLAPSSIVNFDMLKREIQVHGDKLPGYIGDIDEYDGRPCKDAEGE